ncbi:MAG: site-specific integrase, partial [Lachnospiraceae bacterium]|nr:site-specific integrase [Lachnospiraceae bacterium]
KLRNLADSSIKTYTDFIKRFLEYTDKDPQYITPQDVREFLLFKQKNIAATTLNHYNSAIHFFFRRVLHKPWDDDVIPRMKEDHHLPTILSLEEINHLLDCVDDIKYKAIFSLLYGSGLRVSEAVYLDYCDISRKNMTVHVRKSKSRIDRYTILSKKSLDILTEYWFAYNKPMDALFIQKNEPHNRITQSAVQQYLRNTCKKAGIDKHISPHSLRHAFATHLLENGVEFRYIQTLLGHRDPKSTEVYLHLSNKTVLGITSPFDREEGDTLG